MDIEVSGDRTLDLKSQGGHSTTRPVFLTAEVFSRGAAEAGVVEARRFYSERMSQLFSRTRLFLSVACPPLPPPRFRPLSGTGPPSPE